VTGGGGEQSEARRASSFPEPSTPAWSGLYAGAAVGYAWQTASETDFVSYVQAPYAAYSPKGVVGGGFLGVNLQLGSLVAGVETDVEASGVNGKQLSPLVGMSLQNDLRGSLRGRAGVATGRTLLYVTGGAALANFFASALWEPFSQARPGWTVGAGAEYAFTDRWSARLEYRHSDFGAATFPSDNFDGNFYYIRIRDDSARLAVLYRFAFSDPKPVVAK
jgi:outer membrane immunogenic protein